MSGKGGGGGWDKLKGQSRCMTQGADRSMTFAASEKSAKIPRLHNMYTCPGHPMQSRHSIIYFWSNIYGEYIYKVWRQNRQDYSPDSMLAVQTINNSSSARTSCLSIYIWPMKCSARIYYSFFGWQFDENFLNREGVGRIPYPMSYLWQ